MSMFGPLNGVRSALVITAAAAALAAALFGYWIVTVMLGLGIGVHGLGWWYLWVDARRRQSTAPNN